MSRARAQRMGKYFCDQPSACESHRIDKHDNGKGIPNKQLVERREGDEDEGMLTVRAQLM